MPYRFNLYLRSNQNQSVCWSTASAKLFTSYPEASIQVPRYADTVPPTAAPVTVAPTSGPTQASPNAGVIAASVIGSLVALAAIVGGLWYNRNKLPVWKKKQGDKSAVVVPVNVDMDVIPASPPRLVDSQKESKSHNIRIWGSEKDLDKHGEDDVMLFATSQKAVPQSPEVPTRFATPRGQSSMMSNDDDDAVKRYDGEWSTASRGVGAKLAAMLLQSQEIDRWGGATSNRGNEGTRKTMAASDNREFVASAAAGRTLGGNHREVEPGPVPVPMPGVDVDEAYRWLLDHFSGTPHHRQHTDNNHKDDVSITSVDDDVSFLQLSVDNLTLSTRQSPLVTDRSSSLVPILSDEPLSRIQSPMTDKPLPLVTGLSEKPKATSLQPENTWTKGKVQPMAIDMDESTVVQPRSSKRAFAVTEATPNEDNSSTGMVVSAFEFNGSDDDSQVSPTVKDSTVDQDTYSTPEGDASEEQMVEIRRKIREKKALLLAAKGSSQGRGLLPDTRTNRVEDEGNVPSGTDVVSPKTWF